MALDFKVELEKFESDLKAISAMFREYKPRNVKNPEDFDWGESVSKKFLVNDSAYAAYKQWALGVISDERYHPVARYYLIVGDSGIYYFRERLKDAVYFQSAVASLGFVQRLFSADAGKLKDINKKISVVKARALVEMAKFSKSETSVVEENQYVQELKRIQDEENLLRVQRNEFRTKGGMVLQEQFEINITLGSLNKKDAAESEDQKRFDAWRVKMLVDPKFHIISKLILIQSDHILANSYKGILERCVQSVRSRSGKISELHKELLHVKELAQNQVNDMVKSLSGKLQ